MTDTPRDDRDQTNFYSRMNQITEYSNNNRMDTVFIFQLCFIFILLSIGLLYLNSNGFLSTYAMYLILLSCGSVVIFIYLNRTVVNSKLRDKTNWSRINFGDSSYKSNDLLIPTPSNGKSGSFKHDAIAAAPSNCPACSSTTTSSTTPTPILSNLTFNQNSEKTGYSSLTMDVTGDITGYPMSIVPNNLFNIPGTYDKTASKLTFTIPDKTTGQKGTTYTITLTKTGKPPVTASIDYP